MAFRTKPDFSAVWASLGDNTKPVDSYITNGWETVKPPRQYFNWIDNRQDSAIAYLYQAGIPEWDALVDYEGGAGVNSYAQGSNGKIYRCLADNGPNVSSIGAKDPTNALNSAFWTEAFGTKAAVDDLAATVATHTTQIGNGSGVTDKAAWRTALSVDSSAQVDEKVAASTSKLRQTVYASSVVNTGDLVSVDITRSVAGSYLKISAAFIWSGTTPSGTSIDVNMQQNGTTIVDGYGSVGASTSELHVNLPMTLITVVPALAGVNTIKLVHLGGTGAPSAAGLRKHWIIVEEIVL